MRRARRSGAVWIDDFDGGLKFHCHLDEHMGRQIYWRGAYSWRQLQVLDRLVRPDTVFFDVGANQGEFSLFVAKRSPHGRVYAFEPMTAIFGRLIANVCANRFENVVAENVGLWSRSGGREIYVSTESFDDGTYHEGLGTLFRTGRRSRAVETIRLRTLDDFVATERIERLDVLKIDVEGAELGVLEGGRRTLARLRPYLLVEVDPENARAAGYSIGDLFSFLDRWYEFEVVTSTGKSRPVQPERIIRHEDVLCRPR